MKILKGMSLVLILALTGCGGGGGSGGSNDTGTSNRALLACQEAGQLPASFDAMYEEVMDCTGISAAPPRVTFSPTTECPNSGLRRCIAGAEESACQNDPSKGCGLSGEYIADCGTINLPDEYHGAARHEMIHHLLFQAGRADWKSHDAPEWVCQ